MAADLSPTSDLQEETSHDSLWEIFSERLLSDSFLDKFLLALERRQSLKKSSRSVPVPAPVIKTKVIPGQKHGLNSTTTVPNSTTAAGSRRSQKTKLAANNRAATTLPKQTVNARNIEIKVLPPAFPAVGKSPTIIPLTNSSNGWTSVLKTPLNRIEQNNASNLPRVISISLQPQKCVQSVPMTATTGRPIFRFSGKMDAAEIKVKCQEFLSALLLCGNQQSKSVSDNIKTLVQKLVDGKMEPEEFTSKLNSSRPDLIPFLKQSLPLLRPALATGELTVDGIRPPTLSNLTSTAGAMNLVSPPEPPEQNEREHHRPEKRKNADQQDTTGNKKFKTVLILGDYGRIGQSESFNSPPTAEPLSTTTSGQMPPSAAIPLELDRRSPLPSPSDASVSSSTSERMQPSSSNPNDLPDTQQEGCSLNVEVASTAPSTSVQQSSSLVSLQSTPISSTSYYEPNSLERPKEDELLNLCSRKRLNMEEATRLRILALDKDCNIKCTDLNGYPPLLVLCKNNQSDSLYQSLKTLLKRKDIDLVHTNDCGHRVSALTLLCRFYPLPDLIDCVRLLIRRGLSVDLKEKDGRNALYLLCQFYPNDDLVDIARLLVHNAVEFQSALKFEYVLRFRKLFKESEILKSLLQPLRDGLPGSNLQPNQKEMKLSELCSRESLEEEDIALLRELAMDIEVDVNLPCLTNPCPLLLVCSSNRSESLFVCVAGLLQRALDIRVKDSNNWNALIIVCMSNGSSKLLDIVRLFVERGISVRATSKSGWSVLSQAVINLSLNNHDHPDFLAIVRFLLQSGIRSMDDDGNKELRLSLLQEKMDSETGGDGRLSNLDNMMRLLEEYLVIVNIKN